MQLEHADQMRILQNKRTTFTGTSLFLFRLVVTEMYKWVLVNLEGNLAMNEHPIQEYGGSSNTPWHFMRQKLEIRISVMDQHPIQGGVVILLVASFWVPCDGPAPHPGGVVILLVASFWVPCDGLVSHPG